MHDHPSEHGRWARLSWCAVLAQLPAVAALAFNLWASLLALLLDGLGRAAARQACRRSSVQEQDAKDAKDAKDPKDAKDAKDAKEQDFIEGSTGFMTPKTNDKGSRDALLPPMIRPGYSPPLLTNALWGAAAGSACAAAWALITTTTLEHGVDAGRAWAGANSNTSALAFALGFLIGLYRLARWRLFVGDFLREVHRVEEMKVLDQILSRLSREKEAEQETEQEKKKQEKKKQRKKNKETDKETTDKETTDKETDAANPAVEANLTVLDFGGGKGKTSAHMTRHPAVAAVHAIDIEAHPPHVAKYDGRTIPFADGRFDLAVCLYVFHHIPHTRDLVRQLARKAKHVLIFEDLPEQSPSPLVARLTFGAHFLLFDQSVHTHLHHSKEEWRRLLEEEWGCLAVVREFRIPPTAALPYERVALYCEAK